MMWSRVSAGRLNGCLDRIDLGLAAFFIVMIMVIFAMVMKLISFVVGYGKMVVD